MSLYSACAKQYFTGVQQTARKLTADLVLNDVSLCARTALTNRFQVYEADLADSELGYGYVNHGLLLEERADIAVEEVALALLKPGQLVLHS